ncbi:hypothetical protein W04_2833 [Pseudoalteromonas sp. SW0106-04]|uniref:hypothetical protein n=1 Tax=Pseudoalteromonas sp. SW0106-04 TaxID=1702169 RepID=UPI0006B439EC|nr:hypothetical protein [Pseudoalteromonas sp. SW0106-04]GAP76284.1 hypothetical protein W04_2833 [Pseudoalteromonas sp. SW0106-04]
MTESITSPRVEREKKYHSSGHPLRSGVGALFCTLLLIAGCDSDSTTSIENLSTNTSCCEHQQQTHQNITFALSAEQVHPESPFAIKLILPEHTQVVKAHLEGVGMYMGRIPVLFNKVGADTWVASTQVGSCSEPTMRWRLVVETAQNTQQQTHHFQFTSTPPY